MNLPGLGEQQPHEGTTPPSLHDAVNFLRSFSDVDVRDTVGATFLYEGLYIWLTRRDDMARLIFSKDNKLRQNY